jgi:D-glucosaminate-6-phosphate ammonia-lyase
MSQIYAYLGIPTVINAKGPATRVGGGIMEPEVAAAMAEATQSCVDMATLQGRASEIISEVTGAQAGIVTAGAAAGLLLGTAAAVCGMNLSRMNRLPDTRGIPNRVIMSRSQRNFYDHAVRAAGIEIVEVGLPDRLSGAGVRDAEAWEFDDVIDEQTVCVLHVAQPEAKPSLAETVEVAHANGVPVLVDAAAQLPPAENLRYFIDSGADLVAFSGGKAIGGPQASGLLCGQRELIASALLQNLDMDLFLSQWRPPASIFGNQTLRGLPHHGIGRSAKVAKEQVVGLLVALQRFAARDSSLRTQESLSRVNAIRSALNTCPHASTVIENTGTSANPQLVINLNDATQSALDVVLALQGGTPSVHVDCSRLDEATVVIDVTCLRDDQVSPLTDRLVEVLR